MGIAFSQNALATPPFVGALSSRHGMQRPAGPSSPPLHGVVGASTEMATMCIASERQSDLSSAGDAALPISSNTGGNTRGSKMLGSSNNTNNNSNNCSVLQSPLAQKIQSALKALALDWTIVDREIDLITVRFAAALLTSRLRIQKTATRGAEVRDDDVSNDDVSNDYANAHAPPAEYAGDVPSGLDVKITPLSVAVGNVDHVGPQELYVSAALRLAALQLGRDGLQKIIVALAFLANGGETREERRLRRNASLNTNNPFCRAESLQEINHFQRGAGYTVLATANGPAVSSPICNAGNNNNTSGSTLHSFCSSGSALVGRRFATAPHSQTQTQAPAASSFAGNRSNYYFSNTNTSARTGNNNAKQVNNASIDNLSHSTPARMGGGSHGSNNASMGHAYPHLPRSSSSARSGDDSACHLGTSSFHHRNRSVSPLNGTTSSNLSVRNGSYYLRARPALESEFLAEEHSYNNMLLTSMNARSTLLSPLRTGLHGELLYSNSSFATLMSFSTGAGVHTGRSYRGGAGDYTNSNSALRSPVSPFSHTTQRVIPSAPLGGQGIPLGGMASANSLSSMVSPPDSRQRSESYFRRLGQAILPHQVNRLSAVGPAGIGMLSRAASEEPNMSAGSYQLPQAVGGGGVFGIAGDYSSSKYESRNVSPMPSRGLSDMVLQFLRPEAVLTALCSVFAHLHLSADDVTNLVTLLVMAALEVQTDAQLRRFMETDEEVTPNSLQPPSMKQVRTAVRDSLTVLLMPMYIKTYLTLCAAAGIVESDVQAAILSLGALESGFSNGSGGVTQHAEQQQQHPLPKANTLPTDFNAGLISLPPSAPSSFLTQAGERSVAIPAPPFPGTLLPSIMDDVDVAAHVRALHDFFESSVPLESAPNTWSANSAAATALAAAARRVSSTQRSNGSRQQLMQPSSAKANTTTVTVAPYAHLSCSDSVAGPTSSGSMLSRSDVTDAMATFMGTFPAHTDASFAAPSQQEVRCASGFLMDVEAAFVLHFAELIPHGIDEVAGKGKGKSATAASSMPSTASSPNKRLRQRTKSINKHPTAHTTSTPSGPAASSSPSSSSEKTYPWGRRGDADPDMFVQLGSNVTVWPLRTRLLVRRHEYAYVYDAMASTMALLHEDSPYTSDGVSDGRVPHPHTPIALIDLNKATVEKNVNDLQILSGPGDVEVVSLMPSRVSRSSLVNNSSNSGHHRRAVANPPNTTTITTSAAVSASHASMSNTMSFLNSLPDNNNSSNNNSGGCSRIPTNFDSLLNCCWADAYEQDMEVYRMKGSTGTMYLLTMPAEADRVIVSIAEKSPSRTTKEDASATAGSTTATLPEDAIRASVIRSFERNRLARPVVLSLASSAPATTCAVPKESDDSGRTVLGKSPRVQCAYSDGTGEVLSLELGSEPIRIAAYPLRLIYKGILHHFFFPNPSARDHWYQQLLQLSWMTQSRQYLELVAAAPHDVERFIRSRISFPTGPGAFECLDMLGAGTFGRVLLVQHKLSKRLFAMKVIRKSGFHGIRNIIEARREKKILDQLDCPYIMKIHSSFQTDSRVYLLFDYLPGAELLLHTQSAQSNHFDETTSRFYIAELAIAVEYLRVRGIVHRDIKGDNLVLDAEGHVVLTDFGFAKNIMSTSSDPLAPPQVVRQHTSCGTLAYIAPEVLCNSRRRRGYGLAVDWWSLGVVLFTFLTGYFPFLKPTGPETSQAIVSSTLQFPPRPILSDDARSLLSQLLQKDPEKRITSLADLRHHRFFEGFDWTACRERRLPPPLVLHKDSYRSPRTTADARQLLQDRVRRSLAWSSGRTDVPYVPPSHSRRSASDKLTIKYQPQLEEEQAELKLIEQAYGTNCMPKPLSSFNDVFGPVFEQQERCGSDRDESDVEDLGMENYVADISQPALEALKRLRESDLARELCSSFSDLSLNSMNQECVYTNAAQEDRGEAAGGRLLRQGKIVSMPTPPTLVNFNEDLYSDVALAKYSPAVI